MLTEGGRSPTGVSKTGPARFPFVFRSATSNPVSPWGFGSISVGIVSFEVADPHKNRSSDGYKSALGRFFWRICLFGTGINAETDLRSAMFDRCKDLSQQYYQTNNVGNLMALFTGDLETIQECFGWGIMMFFDALFLGSMAIIRMIRMNVILGLLSLIPMILLMVVSTIIGKYMMKKWELRQERYSNLSDFAQENLSGIAVIKAFVKEGKELFFFRKLNRDNEEANVSFTRFSTMLHVSVILFVESVICVILGYGGYLVYKDVFDTGQLVEYISYFFRHHLACFGKFRTH